MHQLQQISILSLANYNGKIIVLFVLKRNLIVYKLNGYLERIGMIAIRWGAKLALFALASRIYN